MYPAVSSNPVVSDHEWTAVPAKGIHEVIIETPDHSTSLADLSLEDLKRMLEVYKDRYLHHLSNGARYVCIFKNWGAEAGASLSHTHTQIISIPMIPPMIAREMAAIALKDVCPYCRIVQLEAASSRLIFENRDWIHIAPTFSMVPYESWILPKDHIPSLSGLKDLQIDSLSQIISSALRRLKVLLDDPPYNYMLYQLQSDYHLNIRVQPVTTKVAGFERGTGIYINSVPPEQAASELKAGMP